MFLKTFRLILFCICTGRKNRPRLWSNKRFEKNTTFIIFNVNDKEIPKLTKSNRMTYQQKREELQNIFSEKFDAYENFKNEVSEEEHQSGEFLRVKSEFEKVNYEFQSFLISFKGNNALPDDELGA